MLKPTQMPQNPKSNVCSVQRPKQIKMNSFPVPDEISLKIVSLLQVWDVCALGSCSRFWRELCRADCIWEPLVRERWPSLFDGSSSSSATKKPMSKGWRNFYVEVHNEKVAKATSAIQFVQKCASSGSIEVRQYNIAMENLRTLQLGYKDVEMIFFKPELPVLVNLLGLHYCICWLRVPDKCLLKGLRRSKISERKALVKWWKVGGRTLNGDRKRDEVLSRHFCLADMAMTKEDQVLMVIYRGVFNEVLRVQICVDGPLCTHWSITPAKTHREWFRGLD